MWTFEFLEILYQCARRGPFLRMSQVASTMTRDKSRGQAKIGQTTSHLIDEIDRIQLWQKHVAAALEKAANENGNISSLASKNMCVLVKMGTPLQIHRGNVSWNGQYFRVSLSTFYGDAPYASHDAKDSSNILVCRNLLPLLIGLYSPNALAPPAEITIKEFGFEIFC